MNIHNTKTKHHNKNHKYNHHQLNNATWKDFEYIDGLHNEEIVFFTFSTGKRDGLFLRDRILPSMRTWMKLLVNVFVMMEDSAQIRLMMRHCHREEIIMNATKTDFTTYKCPNEPTYVLARKCNGHYYLPGGMCCKVDEVINFLVFGVPDLYKRTKYLVFGDDDSYYRVDQLLKWIADVDSSKISHLPLIGNMWNIWIGNKGLFQVIGCSEIRHYGWFQQVLNHINLTIE